MPFSAAAHEEQDRHDDEDDHEDRSNDADAKCCDNDRASLFKSAQTRTISNAPMMTLPSACGCLNSVVQTERTGLQAHNRACEACGAGFWAWPARVDPQTLAALELLAGSGSPMPTGLSRAACLAAAARLASHRVAVPGEDRVGARSASRRARAGRAGGSVAPRRCGVPAVPC